MSSTAQQLADTVLARIRDPAAGAPGNVRPIVREMLDRAQIFVNMARPGWITGLNFIIPTGVVLLHVSAFATGDPQDVNPNCMRVVRVMHQGRDLVETAWRRLVLTDKNWLLSAGPRARLWARLGTDFVAIYPGCEVPRLVTIFYAGVPVPFTAETTETVLREDRLPAVRALAEVLLLLRQQDIKALPVAMESLASQVTRLPVARNPRQEVSDAASSGSGGFGGGGFGGGGAGG